MDPHKTAKQINHEYMEKFRMVFNARNHAIVFAIAAGRDGKISVCQTSDITVQEVKEILKKHIEQMGG